jgi:hypothetical protein
VHNASGALGGAMPLSNDWRILWFLLALIAAGATPLLAADQAVQLDVHWDKTVSISQTTATLQVVVNPPLRRGTAVHDHAFQALQDLNADYVRYVPWLPYPKLGIAELEPPRPGQTSWDFSLLDPLTIDFLEATKGHPVTLNFSTIPAWMFKTDKPVGYPADPDQVTWTYTQGSELRDPSFQEPADYYARLLSWYTKGGFTDELGKRHESGFHYKISHWEVLNEIEFEHQMTPETYTKFYDAVVTALRKVSPETKFVGLALASPSGGPEYFEYFLNPAHHAEGIPLDCISYHFYAIPTVDQTPEIQQFTFFAQADGFLNSVRYIEQIRKRLSPQTKTMVNEIGAISADDLVQDRPGHVTQPIPTSYWGLTGAVYAYIFGEFTRMGIDVAGESQLVGFPTQFPSVSMVDWNSGKPNPRYWVLKLLKDQFGPGDKVVEIGGGGGKRDPVYGMAVVTPEQYKRVLLVNKRDRPIKVVIPGASGGKQIYADQTTGFESAATTRLSSDEVLLNGYSVSSVTLK